MASGDRQIAELPAATVVLDDDLFVLEQNDEPKRLSGAVLLSELMKALQSHGGITSITLQESVGREDIYSIDYVDGTSFTFTVTNGEKGDKGDPANMWIKYASQEPTEESHSFGDLPDEWIGVCSNHDNSAPTEWTAYTWYKFKGNQGDPGLRGDPGLTPNITIGSVVSVDYNAQPSAYFTGTPENPILHLAVPKGKDGVDGRGAADWAVNDPINEGHVLNRTHYHIGDEVLLAELEGGGQIGGEDDFGLFLSLNMADLEAGRRYVVRIGAEDNAEEYYSHCRDITGLMGEEAYAIGNLSRLNSAYADTGEPFVLVDQRSKTIAKLYFPQFVSLGYPLTRISYAYQNKLLDNEYLDAEWFAKSETIGTDGILMNNRSLSFEAASLAVDKFPVNVLDEGGIYKVTWNGTVYECICWYDKTERGYGIGNGALAGLSGGNGEPFCFLGFNGNTIVAYKQTDAAETVTVHMVGIAQVKSDPIPEKFLGNLPLDWKAKFNRGSALIEPVDMEVVWDDDYGAYYVDVPTELTSKWFSLGTKLVLAVDGVEYPAICDWDIPDYNPIVPIRWRSTGSRNFDSNLLMCVYIYKKVRFVFERAGVYRIGIYEADVDPMPECFAPESLPHVILRSSTIGSGKKFKVTVDDSGTISATEVT